MKVARLAISILLAATLAAPAWAGSVEDAKAVAALDTAYQAAVERNDGEAMDRIFHPDFTLVLGNGKTYTRQDLLDSARNRNIEYEKQVEMPGTQTVRLFGKDTATVTALLWLKGVRKEDKSSFDYKLWFSDTYVRTADGWKYAFGQASLRLP